MEKSSTTVQEKAPVAPANENDFHLPSSTDIDDSLPVINDKSQAPTILDENGIPLSKSKLKKLKKDQEWEANRAKRKAKRKEKDQEKKERKRTAAAAAAATAPANREEGGEPAAKKPRFDQDPNKKAFLGSKERARSKHLQHVQLPVTLVLDCGFDDLMKETEIKSLSCQVTRSYSDCHRAPYQARLVVCSFGGRLRERFEGVLACNHKSWKGVTFLEEDFVMAAERARGLMSDTDGGKMAAAFAKYADDEKEHERERLSQEGETVYLTSDSENTLSELKPYSTYIIGGIVDKNRHKGVCYKRARDKGVKTAKLPIGEFMQMQSRFVLATNHVVEIMLRWLECGDWGEAFMRVIPKRKGGSLRVGGGDGGDSKEGARGEEVGDGYAEDEVVDVEKEYQDAVDKDEEESDGLDEKGIKLPEHFPEPRSDEGEKTRDAATKDTSTTKVVDSKFEEVMKIGSTAPQDLDHIKAYKEGRH